MSTRPPSKQVAVARGRVASLSRSRTEHDPEFVAARGVLKALVLEEHIQKMISTWPELTPDQMARLAGLFRQGGGGS